MRTKYNTPEESYGSTCKASDLDLQTVQQQLIAQIVDSKNKNARNESRILVSVSDSAPRIKAFATLYVGTAGTAEGASDWLTDGSFELKLVGDIED